MVVDYCKNYIFGGATVEERIAFQKYALKRGGSFNNPQIYVDFCVSVLDWVKVGSANTSNSLILNGVPSWHDEVCQEYGEYFVEYVGKVYIEDLLNDASLQVFQNGIIFPQPVKSSDVKLVRFPNNNQDSFNGWCATYESTSLEDMEKFAEEYLDEQRDNLLREALAQYEANTQRTPTVYLDFCIGALDWCRVETIDETKKFYDAGVSLWNFGILDMYRDMGYEIKFVPEIRWSSKNRSFY